MCVENFLIGIDIIRYKNLLKYRMVYLGFVYFIVGKFLFKKRWEINIECEVVIDIYVDVFRVKRMGVY